jgi:hypothetical protein
LISRQLSGAPNSIAHQMDVRTKLTALLPYWLLTSTRPAAPLMQADVRTRLQSSNRSDDHQANLQHSQITREVKGGWQRIELDWYGPSVIRISRFLQPNFSPGDAVLSRGATHWTQELCWYRISFWQFRFAELAACSLTTQFRAVSRSKNYERLYQ